MCKTFSGLVTRNGRLLRSDLTDSHTNLWEHFHAVDDGRGHVVPVEYYPLNIGRYDNLDNYILVVDGGEPEWWGKVKDKILEDWRNIVSSMIIEDFHKFLLGGCYILKGKANINKIKSTRIVAMYDNSSIDDVNESSVIEQMNDFSSIRFLEDRSLVISMNDLSIIDSMRDFSAVKRMNNNAKIGDMFHNSSVFQMFGNSIVLRMHEYSRVNNMEGNSRVDKDHRVANIVNKENSI